jgi:hypothetical protein
MTYRNDKDAQDEQTRARILRIRDELRALVAQIGAPSPARRERWVWLGVGALVGGTLTSLVFGGMLLAGNVLGGSRHRTLEGASDSPLYQPDRSSVDPEVTRVQSEMQACAPAGFTGRIQADVTFEGATGAIAEVQLLNQGETTLEQGMVDCVRQTFMRIGTPRFRAPSYLYRSTLIWTDGALTRE